MLILIYGRSGTGKTKLLKHLVNNYNIKEIISATTKEKEASDGNYYYLSKDVMKKLPLAEYSKIENNYYGIPLKELEKANKGYAACVVDCKGIDNLLEVFEGEIKIIKIESSYSNLATNYEKRGHSFSEAVQIINSEMQYENKDIETDLVIENDMITTIQEYAEEVLNTIGFYKGE